MKYLDSYTIFESKHRYSVGEILSDEDAQLIVDLLKNLISLGRDPEIRYITSDGNPIQIEIRNSSEGSLASLNDDRLIIRKDIIDPASPGKMNDASICGILKHELAHDWQKSKFVKIGDIFSGGKGKKFLLNLVKRRNAYKELIGDKSYSMDELEIGANLAPFYDGFRRWIQYPPNLELAKDSLRRGDIRSIFLGDEGVLENDTIFQQMFLFYFGEPGEPLPVGSHSARASMEAGDLKKYRPELHRKIFKSFLITLSSILNNVDSEKSKGGQISISSRNLDSLKYKGLWDKYEGKVSTH